jgi:hypothetical protein
MFIPHESVHPSMRGGCKGGFPPLWGPGASGVSAGNPKGKISL